MNLNTVTDFWAWWSRQIIGLVPAIDPRALANRKSKTEIQLTKWGTRLLLNQRLKQPLSNVQPNADATDIETLAQKIRPLEKVILSIDESLCFVRNTKIPAAAAHRAGEILNLELSRFSPLRKQEAFSVWFPNGTNEAGWLGLTHIVAKRDSIDSAIKVLAHRKIAVAAVVFRDGNDAAAPIVLDESGREFGLRHESIWKRSAAVLSVLFAVSALALTWQWMSRIENTLKIAEEGLQAVQAPAAANRKAIDDNQSFTLQLEELRKLRKKRNSMLENWEELSRMLPDSAWLQSYSQNGSTIILEGSAANAENLIQVLESSVMFFGVKFVSPVIKNPGEEKVRFSISMEREGGAG